MSPEREIKFDQDDEAIYSKVPADRRSTFLT